MRSGYWKPCKAEKDWLGYAGRGGLVAAGAGVGLNVAALSELAAVKCEASLCVPGLSDAADDTATSGVAGLPGDWAWLGYTGEERREEIEATIDPGPFRDAGSGSAGFEAK